MPVCAFTVLQVVEQGCHGWREIPSQNERDTDTSCRCRNRSSGTRLKARQSRGLSSIRRAIECNCELQIKATCKSKVACIDICMHLRLLVLLVLLSSRAGVAVEDPTRRKACVYLWRSCSAYHHHPPPPPPRRGLGAVSDPSSLRMSLLTRSANPHTTAVATRRPYPA